MLKFHQKETCEGIIQRLEAREGKTRRDLRERDEGSHMASSDARVEMTFDQLYALEHTGIEPFDGFTELQNTASRRVEPFRAHITRELSSLFAAGVMLVMDLPADAFVGSTNQVAAIQSALVTYVRTTARTLPSGKNYRAEPVTSQPQSVPFSVTLSRFDGFPGLANPFQIRFSPTGPAHPSSVPRQVPQARPMETVLRRAHHPSVGTQRRADDQCLRRRRRLPGEHYVLRRRAR